MTMTDTTQKTPPASKPLLTDGGTDHDEPVTIDLSGPNSPTITDPDQNTDSDDTVFHWESAPATSFNDIGGYDTVKNRLREAVIRPHHDPDGAYERFDVAPARGVLFHGPPGTGKTMFARALANALNRPFVELDQADLSHPHINRSPGLIKRLFREATANGGVVFIDEADVLLSKRTSHNQHEEDRKITNTFLSALTNQDTDYIVILTTNRLDHIDPAAIRNGRIDEKIKIDAPDPAARVAILQTLLQDIPHTLNKPDIRWLVSETNGATGADLETLIDEARRRAAKHNAPALQRNHFPIDHSP